MAKIYTKRGDTGKTDLLYGGRVSKTDLRCEAYGVTDEAISALGLARALSACPKVINIIRQVQQELFTVGAELATDPSKYATMERHFKVVSKSMVDNLETFIDELHGEIDLPRSFIIPGASPASAAIDLARTILRRAERRVVALKEAGLLVNNELLKYLNRLADLVFIMARYEDRATSLDTLANIGKVDNCS
ncbi:cob(I)yrinic acid a,c-diamide adenosyltransferase [Dehalococcoidia bacterium]|nr:cob(I)yrinic acid a,c-diamide adenosyltransferase [Dehalococcoidia bacterium]